MIVYELAKIALQEGIHSTIHITEKKIEIQLINPPEVGSGFQYHSFLIPIDLVENKYALLVEQFRVELEGFKHQGYLKEKIRRLEIERLKRLKLEQRKLIKPLIDKGQ